MNNTTSQGQDAASGQTGETLCKLVSMSTRRVGAGTTYCNERGGTHSGGYTGRENKRTKQGLRFFSLQFTKSIVY